MEIKQIEKKKLLVGSLICIAIFIATVVFVIVRANNKKIKSASAQNVNNTVTKKESVLDITAHVGEADGTAEEAIAEEAKELEASEEEKEQSEQNVSSKTGYYIRVNYQANCITVYRTTEDGDMQPIKSIICSTGRATPRSGVYSLQSKRRWGQLFGGVWGQYATQVVGNILMHSVPYLSQDPSSLEYWEYDKLGTACSAGCIRLTVSDAQWIFNNMPSGTPVEFYASGNPGPLGKPGAQKISGNEECRGWDPTDPDPDNPWRGQASEVEEQPAISEPEPVNQNTGNNNQNESQSQSQNQNQNQNQGQSQGQGQGQEQSQGQNSGESQTENQNNDQNQGTSDQTGNSNSGNNDDNHNNSGGEQNNSGEDNSGENNSNNNGENNQSQGNDNEQGGE